MIAVSVAAVSQFVNVGTFSDISTLRFLATVFMSGTAKAPVGVSDGAIAVAPSQSYRSTGHDTAASHSSATRESEMASDTCALFAMYDSSRSRSSAIVHTTT